MMSRMENLRFSGNKFSLLEDFSPISDSVRDLQKFLSFEDLKKIFVSPTVITNENLRQIITECNDPAFDEIIGKNGEYYFFKKSNHRESFFKFIERKSNKNPNNYCSSRVISLFEDGLFEKILKFHTLSEINSSFIIAVSVVDLKKIHSFDPEILRDLFGLTLAESRLAICLQNGLSLNDAADQVGVRISTVRDQLSRIFAKTRTSRQSELISLLSRLELVLV